MHIHIHIHMHMLIYVLQHAGRSFGGLRVSCVRDGAAHAVVLPSRFCAACGQAVDGFFPKSVSWAVERQIRHNDYPCKPQLTSTPVPAR